MKFATRRIEEAEIDELVYDLYGLTEEERDIVRASGAPKEEDRGRRSGRIRKGAAEGYSEETGPEGTVAAEPAGVGLERMLKDEG